MPIRPIDRLEKTGAGFKQVMSRVDVFQKTFISYTKFMEKKLVLDFL